MKSLFIFQIALFWALSMAFVSDSSADEPDAQLTKFFQNLLEQRFQQQPLEASRLGDHRFDAHLEDLSPASRAKWLELTGKTLAALPKEVNYRRLTRAAQIDFEILEHSLKTDEWLTKNMHPFEQDPRVYNGYI